jgi:hypothetical protein
MSTTTATATVEVPCDPDTAFEIFTRDIGAWWKRGTYYWNDADRGLQAVADDPFDQWLQQPPDVFHLSQA